MTKLEKVVRGLECCCEQHGGPELCEQCPYTNEPFPCGNAIMRDALALLRDQMPRVMTLEEVYEDYDRVVWIECDDSKTQSVGQYRGRTGWHANCVTIWVRFVTMSFAADYLHRRADKYGKEWRVWSARPSPEQMANTPWEEGEADE